MVHLTGAIEYADCISAKGVRPPHPANDCPGYDTNPSDGEALVLEFLRMWSTPSFLLLPGSL